MKKLLSLLVALFVIFLSFNSVSFAVGLDHIIPKNDEAATVSKKYPVIILTNTTDNDLLVNYYFYLSNPSNPKVEQISQDILVKSNSSITLELPQLSFLGKTGDIRRVWFSWNEKGRMKPLDTHIDTFSFKNTPEKELGMN